MRLNLSELEIRDEAHDGRHKLVLCGKLIGTTAHALGTAIVALCEGDASEIVIDLRKLDFVDSDGVQTLIASQEKARDHGCQFFLEPGQQAIGRLLELVGSGARATTTAALSRENRRGIDAETQVSIAQRGQLAQG